MTMTQVFLNYRAVDEPFGVAMLDRELSRRFGSRAVFLASKSIEPGTDWEERIFTAVHESAALLAIIGRNWLDARDDQGRRRIDDPDDIVRKEILLALSLSKPVIPVRLGIKRLTADQLPEPLAEMLKRQDVGVQFRNHKADVDHLADKLNLLIPELRKPAAKKRPTEARFDVSGNPNSVVQGEKVSIKGGFHAGPAFYLGRGDS